MSPIIEAMKPSPNSDRQSCASLGELFPKNGTAFATESPTTFVSSRPTIFGSSRRPGIPIFTNSSRGHCLHHRQSCAGRAVLLEPEAAPPHRAAAVFKDADASLIVPIMQNRFEQIEVRFRYGSEKVP